MGYNLRKRSWGKTHVAFKLASHAKNIYNNYKSKNKRIKVDDTADNVNVAVHTGFIVKKKFHFKGAPPHYRNALAAASHNSYAQTGNSIVQSVGSGTGCHYFFACMNKDFINGLTNSVNDNLQTLESIIVRNEYKIFHLYFNSYTAHWDVTNSANTAVWIDLLLYRTKKDSPQNFADIWYGGLRQQYGEPGVGRNAVIYSSDWNSNPGDLFDKPFELPDKCPLFRRFHKNVFRKKYLLGPGETMRFNLFIKLNWHYSTADSQFATTLIDCLKGLTHNLLIKGLGVVGVKTDVTPKVASYSQSQIGVCYQESLNYQVPEGNQTENINYLPKHNTSAALKQQVPEIGATVTTNIA